MNKERRLKRLVFQEEVLEYIIGTPRNYIVRNDIPEGASIHDMYKDRAKQSFEVVLQHDGWDEVGEGEIIPQLDIEVHERYCDRCDNEMVWNEKEEHQYCPVCNRSWHTGHNLDI